MGFVHGRKTKEKADAGIIVCVFIEHNCFTINFAIYIHVGPFFQRLNCGLL